MLPKLVRSESRVLSYAVVLAISAIGISCGGGDLSGPSIPASISIDKGFSAIAPAGTELSPPIAVRDRHGNGFPNVEVTLAVAEGDGSLNVKAVTSGPDGHLPGVIWTLGKSALPQTLRATAGHVTATLSASVLTDYELDLRLFGKAIPAEGKAAFTSAAARIKAVIIGSVPSYTFSPAFNANACGGPDQLALGSTSGVIIYASIDSIDGPGKVIGLTRACVLRGSGLLPVLGVMKFDKDDFGELVSAGHFPSLVLHEMLHAVGFGSIWSGKAALSGAGGADPRFVGSAATEACRALGGISACANGVAVENCATPPYVPPICGKGTQDSHWREATFRNELMTGFTDLSAEALSKITIQSLADLGYSTNEFAADPYVIPASGLMASIESGGLTSLPRGAWESVLKPLFVLEKNGSMRGLRE